MKKRHKAFIFHSFMWKSVSDCACAEPNFQKSLNRRVQVCRHNFYGGLGEARAFIPVAQGCSGQRQAGGAPDEHLHSTAPRLHRAVWSRAWGWGLAAGTEHATGINGSHGSPASLQEMVVALRLGGHQRGAGGTGSSRSWALRRVGTSPARLEVLRGLPVAPRPCTVCVRCVSPPASPQSQQHGCGCWAPAAGAAWSREQHFSLESHNHMEPGSVWLHNPAAARGWKPASWPAGSQVGVKGAG